MTAYFGYVLAAVLGIVVIVLVRKLRAAYADIASWRSSNEANRGEFLRMRTVVEPLRAVPGQLVDMLATARAKDLVPDLVLEEAKAIVDGGERHPELMSLRAVLEQSRLRDKELGPIAAEEVKRLPGVLENARRNGHKGVVLYDMPYGRDPRLGSVTFPDHHHPLLPPSVQEMKLSGPIAQIARWLDEQGVNIEFRTELRYANHPDGGGVATLVCVRF